MGPAPVDDAIGLLIDGVDDGDERLPELKT